MQLISKLKLFILLFLACLQGPCFACVFKMGYSETGMPPLIADAPNNKGAFIDIYSLAVKKIGCKLEVKRLPKKQLHQQLKAGSIDFIPGFIFDKSYDPYLTFIPNSFSSGLFGISHDTLPEIEHLEALSILNVTWYMENNSEFYSKAQSNQIRTLKIDDISIELLSSLARENDQFFYVTSKGKLQNFLYKNQVNNLEQYGLKVHKNCCGGEKTMYMAFSKYSPHFRPLLNKNFDKSQPLSPDNTAVQVSKDCMAFKLANALRLIKKSGLSDRIYSKYFQELN